MNPFDMPRTYREALGVFELFRRMGYASDNIFFQFGQVANGVFLMQVCLLSNEVNFTVDVGKLRGRKEALEKQWVDLAQAVADGKVEQKHLDKAWNQSFARKQSAEIALAVLVKKEKHANEGKN